MAPKISRSLPYKLLTVFLSQILLAILIFVAVGHGTWNSQTWTMANDRAMSWDVTLHHIYSKVDCTGKAEFYHTCLSTFKRTAGSIPAVREMICGLEHVHLTAPAKYHDSIRRIASSCDGVTKLDSTSLTVFILLLISGCLMLGSFLSLLKWCYISFALRKKVYYHIGIISLIIEFILTLASLMIYALGLGGLGSIFSYTKPPLVWAQSSGSRGWGYWMVVIALMFHALLFYFWYSWIPRGLRLEGGDDYSFRVDDIESVKRPKVNVKKVKKFSGDHPEEEQPFIQPPPQLQQLPPATAAVEPDSGKKVFWAFMPEVLQPAFGGDDQYLMQQQQIEEQQLFYGAASPSQQQQQQQPALLATSGYSNVSQPQVQYVSQPQVMQSQPQIVGQPQMMTAQYYTQQQAGMQTMNERQIHHHHYV